MSYPLSVDSSQFSYPNYAHALLCPSAAGSSNSARSHCHENEPRNETEHCCHRVCHSLTQCQDYVVKIKFRTDYVIPIQRIRRAFLPFSRILRGAGDDEHLTDFAVAENVAAILRGHFAYEWNEEQRGNDSNIDSFFVLILLTFKFRL